MSFLNGQSKVVSGIANDIDNAKIAAERAYRDLVAAVVEGEKNPANARKICEAAGKTSKQFRADCETLAERQHLARELDTYDDILAQLKRLDKEMREADKVLAQAERTHHQATLRYRDEQRQLHGRRRALDDHRRRLRESAPKHRLAATKTAMAEAQRIGGLLHQLKRDRSDWEGRRNDADIRLSRVNDEHNRRKLRHAIEQIERLDKQKAHLEAEQQAAKQAIEQAEEQLLVP